MMEARHIKILQLLEAIAEDKPISQRELSNSLQMSLGLVNSFIKRLVKKGYCKVTTIPKNRFKYILTPAGTIEKTRLTYEYISSSYHYFKTVIDRLQVLYADIEKIGTTRIIFFGASELAEIALFSLTGTNVHLLDVVDPTREGEAFGHFVVKSTSRLKKTDFDFLLVTTIDDHEAVLKTVQDIGIPLDNIRFIDR